MRTDYCQCLVNYGHALNKECEYVVLSVKVSNLSFSKVFNLVFRFEFVIIKNDTNYETKLIHFKYDYYDQYYGLNVTAEVKKI